jgi:hypothetical protein
MDDAVSESPHRAGTLARCLTAVTAGLLLVNSIALIDLAKRLGALCTSLKWQSAILGSLITGLGLFGLLAWARGSRQGFFGRLEAGLLGVGPSLGWVGVLLSVLLLPVLPLLTMVLAVKAFEPLSLRFVTWWLLTVLGGLLLSTGRSESDFLKHLGLAGVGLGVAFHVAGYLPEISTYPLSLGWSEASRYYNASLFFAQRLYGEAVPWPVLHPSRYLLQSVPFLLGDLPLWVHRLWQVLLWLVVTLGTSLALARRAGQENRRARLTLIGFCYLFLMQGPVYYHLLVSAWIVLAGASARRPWRTLLVVVAASAWAGISRVNWYPVPAILAIVLYLLEQPLTGGRRRMASYFGWPFMYAVCGVLTAFAASRVYAALSGNPAAEFSSSFTSALLWYRLFPSATYPLGVLPGILLASAGPLVIITLWARHHRQGMHPVRWMGLLGALAVLFAGGLVVSAKIGGGGNLHNLDAYLVLLLVTAVYMAFDRAVCDTTPAASWKPSPWLLGASLIVPIAFALAAGGAWQSPDLGDARTTVARIRDAVAEASQAGQAVLFISERHLIAFEHLPVSLEPDYEKVYLMEMAMADNQAYLEAFEADLAAHRFGLIVTERPGTSLRGSEYVFGEENDVWVQRVSAPLVTYYRMDEDLGGIWLMVPR